MIWWPLKRCQLQRLLTLIPVLTETHSKKMNKSNIMSPVCLVGLYEFQNCKKNKTLWAPIPISLTAHWGRDRVVVFQCVLTRVWCDFIINFTSACHSNNNIIKCMVIIAAGSSLISGQIGWSPFSCRIIAKPLTWTWIDTPAGFPLHFEWAPQTPIRHNGHEILSLSLSLRNVLY